MKLLKTIIQETDCLETLELHAFLLLLLEFVEPQEVASRHDGDHGRGNDDADYDRAVHLLLEWVHVMRVDGMSILINRCQVKSGLPSVSVALESMSNTGLVIVALRRPVTD